MKKLKEAFSLLIGLGLYILLTSVTGVGCPIKWLTGVSCAGCGMTRAIFYALQFQFEKAFYYHPLFWMMPFCIICFLLWEKFPLKLRKSVIWTFIICFGAVYLVRLFRDNGSIVSIDVKEGMIARLWRRLA